MERGYVDLSAKNIFRVLAIITAFLLFLGFLYQILGVISWLAAAFLITILLSPLVDWFQRFMPGHNRPTAVMLTLLTVFAVLVGFGFLILPSLVRELAGMFTSLSSYADSVQTSPVTASQTANAAGAIKDTLTVVVKSVTGLVSGLFSGIFAMITIITLSFFMLLDTQRVLASAGRIVPDKYQGLYKKLNRDLFSIVSKYFSGVVIIASIAGVSSLFPLYFTHAPFVLALALTVAVFDLIPMIGATIGTIIVAAACLLSGNLTAAITMTIFIIIYQQVENNVITPLVQKQTVKMSPLAILVALLIGGAVGGIIGTLLAIPAAAFIKVIFESLKAEGFIGKKLTERS
jgi:predicted PurR-regulated permease PerM